MKNNKVIDAYTKMIFESAHIKIGAGAPTQIQKQSKTDLKNPATNIVFNSIKKFAPTYDMGQSHPQSHILHQYVIGKANELAGSNNPEYKKSVFDSYKKDKPEIVGNAKNYDELVNQSYSHASKETQKQFKSLPIKTTFHIGDIEYKNSGHMVDDVHQNHHLAVYRGGDPHTHLADVKGSKVNANEMFRAVHDYYGHALHGNQFGPKGEEIAWNIHRQLYSHTAVPAVTAETRGQNSQVNYTTHNLENLSRMKEHREAANKASTPEEKQTHLDQIKKIGSNFNYAKQVASVLPHEMNSPTFDGTVPHSIKHLLHDPKSDSNPSYNINRDHLKLNALAKLHDPENHLEVTKQLARVHGYSDISHINESTKKSIQDTLQDGDNAKVHTNRPFNFFD